jgi:APA family basic amino acid/polyamine antiporter
MLATSTIFVYRRRALAAGEAATFRMWGYPVLPVLFIAAAAVLLYYSFASNLRNSLIGSAIILCGIPLYLLFRRHRAAESRT